MSRNLLYQDGRITIYQGLDVAVGMFIQMFDNELTEETPEGEGLVLDYSEAFGYEINRTGFSSKTHTLDQILAEYITECTGELVQIIKICKN